CLGKMKDVSSDGRAVLFVSHNMVAIQALCSRSIYLAEGSIVIDGKPRDVVQHYMEVALPRALHASTLAARTDRSGSGRLRLIGFHTITDEGIETSSVLTGDLVTFVFDYEVSDPEGINAVDIGVSLHNAAGETLFVLYSGYRRQLFDVPQGRGSLSCRIERFPIAPGRYTIGALVTDGVDPLDWPRDGIAALDVEAGDFYGS